MLAIRSLIAREDGDKRLVVEKTGTAFPFYDPETMALGLDAVAKQVLAMWEDNKDETKRVFIEFIEV